MSSIVEGYEYDIFISYRQKDNKYDGWVTEFVDNLRKELEATFKEDISIYFDENPSDGILETYDVDKSLEGKLKCLIFIPIISQTYCDPKSFAWQNEFNEFNKATQNDSIGSNIRLTNGNVTGRILPIKIHDLDQADKKLLESELGGSIRSVEFIFKSPGVNRPLKPDDSRPENLNHTHYRDQINKVANAVKEIINALKFQDIEQNDLNVQKLNSKSKAEYKGSKKLSLKFAIWSFLILALAVSGYLLIPMLSNASTDDKDKSIAVLPFVNMSNDPDQEYFSDGLSEELLNLLAKINKLKVIGRTSSFSFKGKNEDLRIIGKKLGVNYILEGSVRKSGDKIRITAQLISAKDGAHLWSNTYEKGLSDIFSIQDEISSAVATSLELTLFKSNKTLPANDSANMESYSLVLQGKYLFGLRDKKSFELAIDKFKMAIELNPDEAKAWAGLSDAYAGSADFGYMGIEEGYKKAKYAAQTAIRIDNTLSEAYSALAWIQVSYEWDWKEAEKNYIIALKLDQNNAVAMNGMAALSITLGETEKAVILFKKLIDRDPLSFPVYTNLALAYIFSSRPEEAEESIRRLINLNPSRPLCYYFLSLSLLNQNEPQIALKEIEKEILEPYKKQAIAIINYALFNTRMADNLLWEYVKTYARKGWWFQTAEIYAFRGEADSAFYWLEQAYINRDGGLTQIKRDPLLKKIEKDSRYFDLLEKLNLPH